MVPQQQSFCRQMARLLRVHGTASVLYMDSLIIASIKESMSCTIFCLFVYKRSGVSPRFRISLMFAKNSERRAVTTATTRMSAVRHRCEVRNIYNKVQKSSKAALMSVSQSSLSSEDQSILASLRPTSSMQSRRP